MADGEYPQDPEQQAVEDKGAWIFNEPIRELGCLPVLLMFLTFFAAFIVLIF